IIRCLVSFFLYCQQHDLTSFPTRRSSDLVLIYWAQGILSFETQMEAIFKGFQVMLYPLSTVVGGFFLKAINDELGMTTYVIEARSEEHTSELQSRENLVCRLLLEKKKNNK